MTGVPRHYPGTGTPVRGGEPDRGPPPAEEMTPLPPDLLVHVDVLLVEALQLVLRLFPRIAVPLPDETRELVDGYAFRFPAELYPEVVGFIANERRCCPFFTFGLEQPRNNGPMTLRITGAEGVKAFLQTELHP